MNPPPEASPQNTVLVHGIMGLAVSQSLQRPAEENRIAEPGALPVAPPSWVAPSPREVFRLPGGFAPLNEPDDSPSGSFTGWWERCRPTRNTPPGS